MVCLLLFSGCSTNSKDENNQPKEEQVLSSDVKEVMNQVLEDPAFNLPGTMEVDEATLKSVYNIDAADVKQYAIAFPMINVQATEIIIMEAKDGKLDTIQTALDARMKTVEDTWATYLPEQYELVKNRKTIKVGNCIVIVIAEKADDIMTYIEDSLS